MNGAALSKGPSALKRNLTLGITLSQIICDEFLMIRWPNKIFIDLPYYGETCGELAKTRGPLRNIDKANQLLA